MSFFQNLKSFRAKLIIGLIIPVIIIFGFDFYIFTQGRQFEMLLQTQPLTQDKIQVLEKGLQNFSRVSFFFLSLVIIFNLGSVIILVMVSSFALRMILDGIKKIEGGDLSFRIPLNTKDEFGTIVQFLNIATAKVQITQQDIEQKVIERTNQLNLAVNQLNRDKTIISAERNKLEVALSGITDAVLVMDLGRKVVICNKAAERIIGLPAHTIVGNPLEQIIQVYDKNWPLPIDEFCPVRTDTFEGVIFKKENLKLVTRPQLMHTETGERFVNIICSKIKDNFDINVAAILTLHDNTKEQELEKMKLDFVSMAAHELRTPLTAIKGYIYIFIRDYLKNMDEKQSTIFQRLNISAQKLATLIENLLNISRIERGTLTVNLQAVDWAGSIENTISEVEVQVKDKKLDLTVDIPSGLPKVYVDPQRIGEVLSNLLSNAINYTESGGKINIKVEQIGDELVTHVSDTGQGIPKEALPHLFTKFFRVSGPLEQGSKGTGLGLYIARSMINMHKGRIWVESELGKGSTFSFSLPVFKELVHQNPLGVLQVQI